MSGPASDIPMTDLPANSPGTIFNAEWVLLPDGWHQRMAIHVGSDGMIDTVVPSQDHSDLDVVIPGMVNAHSHAFQRGLLGRTQRFQRPEDDFWSWRTGMYRAAEDLTPERQEAIAFRAFQDMLRAGYTSVCEFHYTHGAVRMDHGEIPVLMAEAVLRAADRAGIRIRLLPVCYQHAGFGQAALHPRQRSFGLDTSVYLSLIEHLTEESGLTSMQDIGYAPHSLRAVGLDTLRSITDHRDSHLPGAPIHIHVAEQVREVNECVLSTRKRPVEYMLDAVGIDESWCLVHATHMTDAERQGVVDSRATICLCPTTEGDLGDGFFPLADYVREGGQWAIGSDSNVCIDPAEELRMLDWQQRLHQRRRNPFRFDGSLAASTRLYQAALEGGRAASGLTAGRIAVGHVADFVELRRASEWTSDLSPDELLAAWMYSGHGSLMGSVITNGTTRWDAAGAL